MKRRINFKLFYIAMIPVVLAGIFCIIGAAAGPFFVRTKGTSHKNIEALLDAICSGDGAACADFTSSYKEMDFRPPEEEDSVSRLCKALQKSYHYELLPDANPEGNMLTGADSIIFSSLDLQLLEEAIAADFDRNVYDIVMESDANVTSQDGKYLPEIYEKAYANALDDVLQDPAAYEKKEEFQLNSSYDPATGRWDTEINKPLAGMLMGGVQDGARSDTLSLSASMQKFVEDSLDTLKGEPAQKKTVYTLPYSATVGSKPDPDKYAHFSIDQADQVMNLIAYARSCGLLGDQEVIFNPDAAFYPEDIICYCDETILVICWKEYIQGSVANCMEVKLADGSQIKRKVTGDVYNSGILDYLSNMSAATNAVAAMSGDYYAYRFFGTTVYQGQVHRFDQYCELLMVDDQGRFLFYYPDGSSADALQQFVDEHHVQFGLAFGPVLVEDYTPRYYTPGYAYGLGQMTERFTRAAFGEFDDLHYLFMTSGYAVNAVPPADLNAFIEMLLTKNLKNVYNMDGGQTAEIVIQNMPYNQIDYRAERQMSDMIFFATALPENEDE